MIYRITKHTLVKTPATFMDKCIFPFVKNRKYLRNNNYCNKRQRAGSIHKSNMQFI